ncbi:hypothetical protein MARPU_05725 [Marichromatium purpuratum 984]|uniref:DUF1640 domain-containing protein n=1 Tax=Marichromatium purpuratum 984 TaxID=765910 RepID=W0DYA3_MARPU|nr:hypothetical protein [Marichromatium purpuratum]AHF03432.1 hypothetical protein MARPU_05725 [Marichromatium purpuratum 984]
MTTITFDTHQFIRTIKDAGIPENQAEAIAQAFKEAQTAQRPVTPEHLDYRLRELELKMDVRIAEARADLTRWIIGAGLLQTTVIIGVLLKVAGLV